MNKKNGFTLTELMIVVAIIAILFSTIGLGGACVGVLDIQYSDGARVGVINKFSEKGFMWKTYEGEMALEGISSTGNTIGANIWQFSIDGNSNKKEDIARKLEKYRDSSTKVKVTYREIIGKVPWRGSTGYFVQNVEPVNKEQSYEK